MAVYRVVNAQGGHAQTEFDPDLVAVPVDEVGDAKFTAPPLLVVEIRSPSTGLDLNRRKAEYEKFGVPSYWVVDPDLAAPLLGGVAAEVGDGGLEAVGSQPRR